ncbi:MAG TPA: cytochrome c maturation protein CcmE [Polyangiaceae bacterium]
MTSGVELHGPKRSSERGVMHGRALLVGALVLGAMILVTVFGLAEAKPIYARGVSEFVQSPQRGTRVRIQGVLVQGSLCRVTGTCEVRFRLRESGFAPPGVHSELEVGYERCVMPDTVRDLPGFDLEVTVEGELCDDCSRFEATQIFGKCPTKYELPTRGTSAPAWRPVPAC